jgi:DNA polymerase
VSAEDRLRRYLEQRRELGESEFVLDTMSVDEVMRIIGALGGGGAAGSDLAPREGAPAPVSARHESERQVDNPERNGIDIPETADWREALRAAGAGGPPERAARQQSPGAEDVDAGTERQEQERPEATGPEPQRAAMDAPQGIVVGERFDDEPVPEIAACRTLEEVAALVARCQRCDLYRTALNPVPGEGNPNARLMCIGEAPGAKEDETGRPFVGAAGELLTKILAAINLRRDEVFIANVLKHRPPGNRNPLPAEVTACSPYLVRQVALIRPKVIITFGAFAAQTLLDTKLAIGKLRGAVHRYHGIPVVVTYHPAALLRNPAWKRPTWEDVQLARRILDKSAA